MKKHINPKSAKKKKKHSSIQISERTNKLKLRIVCVYKSRERDGRDLKDGTEFKKRSIQRISVGVGLRGLSESNL